MINLPACVKSGVDGYIKFQYVYIMIVEVTLS